MVDTFNINIDETLDGQNEFTIHTRRSYMYEFILLFIIAIVVLVITISNLTSDTVTTAGYIICCIILVGFAIAVIMYLTNLMGSFGYGYGHGYSEHDDHSGPVVRIHYV
jgi:heme/copper-type cytochrome/quinol oxidase subunit 4